MTTSEMARNLPEGHSYYGKTIIMLLSIIRDILIQLLPKRARRFLVSGADFAFLVHARDFNDIRRKFPVFKYLPEYIIAFFCRGMRPIIFSEIVVGNTVSGGSIRGLIVGVPMTGMQMLNDPKKAGIRIMQTLRFAEKLDVKILGLGALFSSLTNSGLMLSRKTRICVTNGNSLTTAVVMNNVRDIVKKHNLDISFLHFAVIGGSGSIGSCVASLLANEGVRRMTLIGRKIPPLDDLKKRIVHDNPDVIINVTSDMKEVETADFILAATMSGDAVIRSEHIKKCAFLLDITQPGNVSKEIRSRRDVHYIKGGMVKAPGIKFRINLGMPAEVIFACLAETILLSMSKRYDNYFLGKISAEQVREISKLAAKTDFVPYMMENI